MRLVPDKIFSDINAITPSLLKSEGVLALVLDIDNTLAPRYIELPDEALKAWIAKLRSTDVKLYIISNNRTNRVAKFARALDVPYFCNGMKPFPRAFMLAVKQMDIPREHVAAVGDQIYTDVFGAHLAGIRAWLVKPIDPHENLLFKVRRWLEQPFLNRFYKQNGGDNR